MPYSFAAVIYLYAAQQVPEPARLPVYLLTSFFLHLLEKWDEVNGNFLWDLCFSIYLQVWLFAVLVTHTGRDFI